MLRFFAFRFNVIEPNASQQRILFDFDEPHKSKEEKFFDVINNLIVKHKETHEYLKRRIVIFHDNILEDDIFSFSYAREERYSKPIEGLTSIEKISGVSAPNIYIIIDVSKQIILIQDKPSVFQNVDTPRKGLELYLNNKLRKYNLTCVIEAITNRKEFWREIELLNEIEEFDLTLAGPNLFGGRHKAADFVKEVHQDYNITEVKITLKNIFKQLRLHRKNLEEFISLAASGAGEYFVKAYKDGKPYKIKSTDYIADVTFNADESKDIDSEKLKDDLTALNKLNEGQPMSNKKIRKSKKRNPKNK